MTFQEAIELKTRIGKDTIVENGVIMRVLITPEDKDDFNKYVNAYRSGNFTDDSAKRYSMNSKFKIAGLWTDGANVLHKTITQ